MQGAAAEYRGAKSRVCNGARLFHGAGAAGAAMDPAEGAGCRCRVPRCRKPFVQQLILLRVQDASTKYCRVEDLACNEKSALLHLQTVDHESQGSALCASHMHRSCFLSRCYSQPSNSAIQNSLANIFLHSTCVLSVRIGLCDSMSEKMNLSDRLSCIYTSD